MPFAKDVPTFGTSLVAILGLVLISSTVFAGSYDFECTAYSLNKSGQIDKLTMNRTEATLDSYTGISLSLVDRNTNLLEGQQTYENNDEKIVVKATVTAARTILSLDGNIGPRDHNVQMSSVNIKLARNGVTKNFVGSCTETTVTSCGGSCN